MHISEHFFELRFPVAAEALDLISDATAQVTPEVMRLLQVLTEELSRSETMHLLALKDEKHFRQAYLQAGITQGVIEMTIPEKPQSRLQKYRLTQAGEDILRNMNR